MLKPRQNEYGIDGAGGVRLSSWARFLKRAFDITVSALGIALTFWIVMPFWAAASLDTRKNGFFFQKRVGRNGRLFSLIKLRTMRDIPGMDTTVTADGDPRITRLGRFLRRFKIDELPQLINVLIGDMSFVGPRPDVPGFADRIEGADRIILSVRPGITGPATLKYRDEERLLSEIPDPERYNKEVIWPDKVRLNRRYVLDYGFANDIKYIIMTITGKRFDG